MIPENHKENVMMQYHDGALGRHLSLRKTMSRIKEKYYWEDMRKDITEWINSCQICATRKNTGVRTKVPLCPMPVTTAPMERCAMDVIGPLPESVSGNKFILVFMDYFTKFAEAFAMTNQKAETIAEIFVEKIIFKYGPPRAILTDRGTNFLSNTIKRVNDLFGILKLNTT